MTTLTFAWMRRGAREGSNPDLAQARNVCESELRSPRTAAIAVKLLLDAAMDVVCDG